MSIKQDMPLLARHEGEWEGTYTVVDPEGKVTDRHRSHLTCSFPSDGSHDYYQVNRYTWDDGRTEEHRFPGRYLGGGRMAFDTERIKGETWELDGQAIYLHWIYRAEGQDLQLFELIVLSRDGRHRSRVWQWIRDGVCVQRTLIDEMRLEG
ncbi:DUF3598 family protein [Nonomuraea soli]|uniref:DUF3598 domain-containing protein n=1 Tax=Nonomuraea soli TaxID=1032476 RepID=A0A7W0CGT9_9ACTN|nr:DUF3598 family protein [Nonomuraea soli]MBA2890732.1 hypothetical protein [Nonomuraea soli]